jgi:hypothetical protein
MSAYSFSVHDITPDSYAAAPQLIARLQILEDTGQRVHALALRAQVRIEPQRRGYDAVAADKLRVQFGARNRWGETLRPFLWMHCSTLVPGFRGSCQVDLPMPCSYDFDVVASRYLHALDNGVVPLTFLFSGTVFTKGTTGFGVEQVPWDCEAGFELPVVTWRELIDAFYPNSGWLRLDRDLIAALADYRARYELTGWDETVQRLLDSATEVAGEP